MQQRRNKAETTAVETELCSTSMALQECQKIYGIHREGSFFDRPANASSTSTARPRETAAADWMVLFHNQTSTAAAQGPYRQTIPAIG
jgi:hypothetical protein